MKTTITTPRLILRPYRTADFKAVHEYSSDRETLQFMTWGPNSEKETKKYIAEAIKKMATASKKQKDQKPDLHFAVTLKSDKKLIGGCRISIRGGESDRKADIGCVLHKDYWHAGYATEICEALLKHGFKNLKLHRILGMFRPEHTGSHKLCAKLSMRLEGTLRKNTFYKGKWHDTLQFAILEEEYFKRQKK
ncbi:MAG TPA: GNAT family protein [Candidatus Gracilibacteria bacterium]|nr:GNAT family protein [Candidatus Gracilibacteria bacterium]